LEPEQQDVVDLLSPGGRRRLIRGVNSKHVLAGMGHIFKKQPSSSSRSSSPASKSPTLSTRSPDCGSSSSSSNSSGIKPCADRKRPPALDLPLLTNVDAPFLPSPSIKNIGRDVGSCEASRIYELSFETKVIDRFISHSWSAGWFWKWFALCDLFHRKFAVGFTLVWWLTSALTGVGVRLSTGRIEPYAISVAVHILTPAGVLLYTLTHGLRSMGSTCFLDKLCVHQSDDELKLAGMSSMSDCLKVSQNLTILWSDDYFERLWCVFELAVFAHSMKGSDKRIEFTPLWVPPFVFGFMACNILVVIGLAVVLRSPLFYGALVTLGEVIAYTMVWCVANFVPAIFISSLTRRKLKRVQSMLKWMASFTLDKTKVTDESDRRVLYKQIRRMFGSTANFEEYVRTDFRKAVVNAVGRPGATHYQWAIIIFMPYAWFAAVDTTSMLPEGVIVQVGSTNVVKYCYVNYAYYFSEWCIVGPLLLRGLSFGQYLTSSLSTAPALVFDILLYQLMSFVLNWLSATGAALLVSVTPG